MTEGITDTNIPSIQLMVGMGIPLWRIPCLRATYNKEPNVSSGRETQAFLQSLGYGLLGRFAAA